MEPFITHTGVAVPLPASNVDTDQIIPARYLKSVRRTGFAEGLFAGWRAQPGFVLDDPTYASGSVLVAGPDFGTGSSREHAVWALLEHGFRVVISARFGDIFRGNSGKAGLLTAQVSESDADRLFAALAERPGREVTVDLRERTITADDLVLPFAVDDHVRHKLLEGLDDIGLTLRHEGDIVTFEERRPAYLPHTR